MNTASKLPVLPNLNFFQPALVAIKNGARAQIQGWLEQVGNFCYDYFAHHFCAAPKARDFDEIKVGQAAERSIVMGKWRIFFFALVSGDFNLLHFNRRFAAQTRFRERIAHGLILGGVVSGILGTELPGLGTYYCSQGWKFVRPVRIGDSIVVRVAVTALDPEKRRVSLRTEAFVGEKLVAIGDGEVGLDEHPYGK